MDDDQLIFWYTNGRSVRMPAKKPAGIAWDRSLTPAENFARFRAANEKWKAEHGKNR